MITVWKVSKYGVISVPYFPVFQLNTEIYDVNLCIQSECRNTRTRNNSVFGHFSRSGYVMVVTYCCNMQMTVISMLPDTAQNMLGQRFFLLPYFPVWGQSLYEKIRVRVNPYSGIFYAVNIKPLLLFWHFVVTSAETAHHSSITIVKSKKICEVSKNFVPFSKQNAIMPYA